MWSCEGALGVEVAPSPAAEEVSTEGERPPLAGETTDASDDRVTTEVATGRETEVHRGGASSESSPFCVHVSLVSMAFNIGLRSSEPTVVSMRIASSSASSVSMATISIATASMVPISMVTGALLTIPPRPSGIYGVPGLPLWLSGPLGLPLWLLVPLGLPLWFGEESVVSRSLIISSSFPSSSSNRYMGIS